MRSPWELQNHLYACATPPAPCQQSVCSHLEPGGYDGSFEETLSVEGIWRWEPAESQSLSAVGGCKPRWKKFDPWLIWGIFGARCPAGKSCLSAVGGLFSDRCSEVNATTSGQLLPGPLVAVLRMHWPAELLFLRDRTSYNLSIHRMPFHGAFATELKSRSAISSCCCPSPITEIRGLWWVDLVRLEISGRYFCLSHQILLVCCWSVFPLRPTYSTTTSFLVSQYHSTPIFHPILKAWCNWGWNYMCGTVWDYITMVLNPILHSTNLPFISPEKHPINLHIFSIS